jgi:hypothetical protein
VRQNSAKSRNVSQPGLSGKHILIDEWDITNLYSVRKMPKWKDAGCLHESLEGVIMPDTTELPTWSHERHAHQFNDEYICHEAEQVKLRYLFRIHMANHPITSD